MKASVSQIKFFKSCPKAWEFKYNEKLTPVQTSDALVTGKRYHEYLEMLEKGEQLPDETSKEMAMVKAYEKYIFPRFKVMAAEAELEKRIGNHILHGFVDGLTYDGYIVEHKTTSRDISEGGEYEYDLLWDEQVLAYMALTGSRKVYYTVCKKPTIRQKKDESDEEFYNRMIAWYDDDTAQKIRLFIVERTDAEVAAFENEFQNICDAISNTNYFYRNTCNCNNYGRRCGYSSICLYYDPAQEYVEFIKEQ